MTLQELVRRNETPILDALSGLSRRLDELQRERSASELRRSQAHAEAAGLRTSIDKQDSSINELDQERENLLHEVRKLQREIREKEVSLEQLRSEREAVKEQAREGRKSVQSEDQRVDGISKQIDESEAQRLRLAERLRATRVEALRDFLRFVEQRLEELDQKGDVSAQARKAAEGLRAARDTDPRVAQVCEERESWLQIISSSPPAGVRTTADVELKRLEKELEASFPGALTAPKYQSGDAELEELFYVVDAQGEAVLILPITAETWGEISAGANSAAARRALELLWSIRTRLAATDKEPAVEVQNSVVRYSAHVSEQTLSQFARHPFALRSGASVAFLLSQLPDDVLGALA